MSLGRHLIVHYHFFKNGGSTLVSALERNFGDNFASIEADAHNKALEPAVLVDTIRARSNLQAISSHTLRPPLPRVEGISFHEIFVLRHPLDRLRSMYDFYSTKADAHPLARQAKTLDLPSFLKFLISDYPHLARDSQLRTLAAAGGRIAREFDLATAEAMLRNAAGVLVLENYDAGLATTEHYLQRFFPKIDLSYTSRNVSHRRLPTLEERLHEMEAQCGSRLYRELLELNQLDTQLLTFASREADRRYREMASPEAVLRDFVRRLRLRMVVRDVRRAYDRAEAFARHRARRLVAFIRPALRPAPPDHAAKN